MKKRQTSQITCKASKSGNAVRERQAKMREEAGRLTNLNPGDEFERDGHLWRVFKILQMGDGAIWSADCHKVNRKTRSTFGKVHSIPFIDTIN